MGVLITGALLIGVYAAPETSIRVGAEALDIKPSL